MGAGGRVLRTLLLVLGAALTANAAWLALTANLTVGTGAAALLGLGLLAWGGWFPRLRRVRWLTAVAVLVALLVVPLSAFLAVVGTADDVRHGAAVHGSELSRTLAGRLDRAVDYHARNPRALLVVTGGRGPQEDLPEAVAMREYLRARGVPDDLIVVEDRATSTEENFTFSRALLDARLPSGYRVAFVTDEFHVYRAGRIAAAAGLDATHASSRTPWYFWAANYLREDLLVLGLWATGRG